MLIYYVYAYIRKSDGTPYYIGKGKDDRAYEKHSGIGRPNDKSKIVFLETNLSEVGAFALERRYIAWWGRKDLATGILLNKTDGGEGASGAVISQATRDKQSAAQRGRVVSDATKLKMSASQKLRAPATEATRAKVSAKHKGKITSEAAKEKMRLKNSNPSPETIAKLKAAHLARKTKLYT